MLVRDVFEDIFTGFNMSNATDKDIYAKDYYFIQKDSIQYTNIIEKKLVPKRVQTKIKNKYIMHERDIIISLKKPYKVGTYRFPIDKEVVIPNNFIILRGVNMELYSYIFITNYLEHIGIEKFVKENNFAEKANKELSVEDIKSINLPNISKNEQMKISNLINNINERSAIYSSILENDEQIIRYALDEVIGENHDR